MASTTPNLALYKKNPATDGNDTFDIKTMINDNLDKIDAFAGGVNAKLQSAALLSATLKRGLNYLQSNESSPLNVTVQGRTLVNLLGRDGNCEDISKFTTVTGATIVLDPNNKTVGNNGIKITTTSTGLGLAELPVPLDQTKYYLFTADIKNGTAPNTLLSARLYGTSIGSKPGPLVTNSSSFTTNYVKIAPSDLSGLTSATVRVNVNGTAVGQTGYVDGIRVFEIDAATYAKIDADPEYSGDKLAEKFPYVDSVMYLSGVYLAKAGKNLLPPFTEWTLHTNAIAAEPYKLTLNASASSQQSTVDIPCLPSAVYTFSIGSTNGKFAVNLLDSNKSFISFPGDWTATQSFTTTPATAYIRVIMYNPAQGAGTFTFTNPQLEFGSVATAFEPRNDDYMYVPTTLAGANGVYDTFDSRTGRVLRRWMTDQPLDGSLLWAFSTDYAGYKTVRLDTTSINGYAIGTITNKIVTKYDGKVLSAKGSSVDAADIFTSTTPATYGLVIGISDTDSGWGESYTPTVDEIKAYFYGWRMYVSGSYPTPYNGTGIKAWSSIFDTNVTTITVPTTFPENLNGKTFMPYKLTYQLAKSVEEAAPVEGSVSVHAGGNQVELGEGVIVRERANPVLNAGGTGYDINNLALPNNALKNRPVKILAVYRNGQHDKKWSFYNNGQSAAIAKTDYDPAAEYTVTYIALDKYALTVNTVDVAGEYQGNVEMVIRELAKRQADIGEAVSVIQTTYARKGQGPWIAPTLLNGWVNYLQSRPTVGYMKDEFGFVHLKGMIKSGTVPSTAFILPKGYRPLDQIMFVVVSADATTQVIGTFEISADGIAAVTSGKNNWLSLEGLTFRAEQ